MDGLRDSKGFGGQLIPAPYMAAIQRQDMTLLQVGLGGNGHGVDSRSLRET